MPLSPEQTWIAKFTGGKGLSSEDQGEMTLDLQLEVRLQSERRRDLTLREVYVARARGDAEKIAGELAIFRKTQVQTSEGSMGMIGKGGDQSQGFGFTEDMGKVKESPKTQAAMTNAMGKVLAIRAGLEGVKVPRSALDAKKTKIIEVEGPLFEARDIEEELYTPLVRRLLFPEELVADEFSATQRMIDGSNQSYIDELVERSGEDNRAEEWGNALKAVVTAVKDLSSAAVAITPESDAYKKLVNLGLTVAEAIVNTGVDIGVNISKADAGAGVGVVLSGLSNAVKGLVKQYTGDDNLANYIGAAMKGGSFVPRMVGALTKEGTPEQKAGLFLAEMGGLWSAAFDLAAVGNTPQDKATLAGVQAGVTALYSVTARALQAEVITKIEKRDWRGLQVIFVQAAGDVVKGALAGLSAQQILDKKTAIDQDSDGEIRRKIEEQNPGSDQIEELYTKAKDKLKGEVDTQFAKAALAQGSGLLDSTGGVGKLIGMIDKEETAAREKELEETAAKQNAKVQEEASQEADERLKAEEEAFAESLLVMGKDQLSESDLKSIGKLIAQVQRDEMIMKTAFAFGGLGFAVASQFFAPMALAGTLVKFVETLAAAVNRAIELRRWVDTSEAALNAVSPYLTSIQNFVRNQAEQFSHYTIKCALIALQAAAQVTQIAGAGTPAQGVGLVVEKGAKLAETLEDLSYKFYRQAALVQAWKITKPALRDPKNRKANLIARRLNPTLAKYTLAYGAVTERDPVALEAFRAIGLDNETLAAKDAKVGSVQKYLAARYSEDIQVYGAFEGDSQWIKRAPVPALTSRCFLTLHSLAVREAKVEDQKPNAITKALLQAEGSRARFVDADAALRKLDVLTDDAVSPHLDAFQQYEADLRALRGLLGAFAPPRADTHSPDDDLQGALQLMADLADTEIMGVELARADLTGRAPQIPQDDAPPP